MSYTTIETELKNGVAYVWLNRPDLRNAMNDVLIGELTRAVADAIADDAARVIVLGGRGKAFCAGADLAWMKKGREMTAEQAREDTGSLARVMRMLYESPKPAVARVHGAAFAGGMGLVSRLRHRDRDARGEVLPVRGEARPGPRDDQPVRDPLDGGDAPRAGTSSAPK